MSLCAPAIDPFVCVGCLMGEWGGHASKLQSYQEPFPPFSSTPARLPAVNLFICSSQMTNF